MPVSRNQMETVAEIVAGLFADAELRLLLLISESLMRDGDAPNWAELKQQELQQIRRRAAAVMMAVQGQAVGAVTQALVRAYLRGTATAQADAEALLGRKVTAPVTLAEEAVAALVQSLLGNLDGLTFPILRQVEDAYQVAVFEAVGSGVMPGVLTRLQTAQGALNDLRYRGLTGFTDSRGRRWGLRSYVEMATRTASAQALVQGHLDRLEQAGIPLVIVSNSSRECERCRPWEGKILARGPVPAKQRNALTGELMIVRVDGTVAEATSAGLFHPNCTHSLSAYLPGATTVPKDTANPEGYAEKVEQRRLERKVREWKRAEALALTPEEQRRARAKVRAWQARVKAHTGATGLPRKRARESGDVRVAR